MSRADNTAQKTRDIEQMLPECWANVCDVGPTLQQNLVNVSCLLGDGTDVFLCSSDSQYPDKIITNVKLVISFEIILCVCAYMRRQQVKGE